MGLQHYDDLLDNPVNVLWDLNFRYVPDPRNCPATADALDNFLANGVRMNALSRGRRPFQINASYEAAGPIEAAVAELNRFPEPNHVVVRGNRRRPPEHYFVLLRHRGNIYVADPYTHELLELRTQAGGYFNRGRFISFSYTRTFDANP